MDFISRPLKLYCDNSVVLFMAKKITRTEVELSISTLKYLVIRECIKEKKVVNEHNSIGLMIPDPLKVCHLSI